MPPKFAPTAYVLSLLWLSSRGAVFSQTPTPAASPSPSALSPDKKWEYTSGDQRKIVKAGKNEVSLDLSHECAGSVGSVIWAPDSKRFAFSCGGKRLSDATLKLIGVQSMRAARPLDQLYQLRGREWKALKAPNVAVDEILNNAIAAEVKKSGLPKKTELSPVWQTLEFHQWADSNTAILYGGLEELVTRGEDLNQSFVVHLLVTLKFDEAGNWKIVKTHPMSEKEIENREKEQ